MSLEQYVIQAQRKHVREKALSSGREAEGEREQSRELGRSGRTGARKEPEPRQSGAAQRVRRPTKLKRQVLESRAEAVEVKSTDGADEATAGDETVREWACRLRSVPPQVAGTPQAYCRQLITPQIDQRSAEVLSKLAFYQRRLKDKKGGVMKKDRRFVLGIREVQHCLDAGTLRLAIIAPDVEDGACNEVQRIVDKCEGSDVPVVFALSRKEIGAALGISSGRTNQLGVSVAGLLKIDGAEVEVKTLLSKVAPARREWHETRPDSALRS